MWLRCLVMTVLGFVLLTVRPVFADAAWKEKKSHHFIVYEEKESSFSDEVLRRGESVYQDIIRYFGALSPGGFWTWDNRCQIYLYRTREFYVAATRQPAWSSGFANIAGRAIVSYVGAPGFLDSVLPHEMGHLVFREFIQEDNREVPRWLDEGFAIAQEAQIRTALDETIRKAVRSHDSIPVSDLSRVGSWHNLPAEEAKLFYAEAQSLTRFLLDRYDSSHFIQFCRLLRDGATLEDALRKSYYQDFPSIAAFEKEWKHYVLSQ